MDATTTIALSGLNTASTRLQVSASNLVNQDDAAPLPGSGIAGPAPFVPTRVSEVSVGSGGVQAQLSAAQPATVPAYAPDSPYADAQGMIGLPDVNMVGELVEQMQALQQYRASVAVLKADDRLQKSTIDLLS
jgi:flagellar basal-body rod protein FlgC